MGKIEINEENYKDYQEFLDAKNCISTINHPMIFGIVATIGVFVAAFGSTLGMVFIMMSIMKAAEVIGMSSILEVLTVIISIGGYFGTLAFVGIKILPKQVSKYLIKRLQKKHPDFDMSLSKGEVEKELEKYRQLSKVPKDIDEKKEEHLDKHKNDSVKPKEKMIQYNKEC